MNAMKLFTGRAHPALARKICEYLGLPLGRALIGNFPDGEISCKIDEDVRGRDVYILQPTCPPVNETLMELLIYPAIFYIWRGRELKKVEVRN